MSFNLVRDGRLRLLHGVALVLLGVTAGCSSGVTRFTDGLVTSSTGSGQPIDSAPYVIAPVDDNYAMSQAPAAPSGGSVQRTQLAAPAPQSAPVYTSQPEPVRTAQLPQAIDPLSRSVERDSASYNPAPNTSSISGSYKVEPGDTLSSIARRSGVSVATLRSANSIDGENIRIGQTLRIPSGSSAPVAQTAPVVAKVEKIEPKPAVVEVKPAAAPEQPSQAAPLPKEEKPKVVAYTPPSSGKAVAEAAQNDDVDAPDSTGIGKMRWPVKGRVISAFGQGAGNYRDGIDIQVPPGTSVKAAENGVVIYAGDGLKDFGNTVLVRHEDGLVTVYGNASELKVKRGQTVKRGQEVALSGISSSNDTPKLHFEVRKDSAAVDPKTYLQ